MFEPKSLLTDQLWPDCSLLVFPTCPLLMELSIHFWANARDFPFGWDGSFPDL